MNLRTLIALVVTLISVSLPVVAFADWTAAFPPDTVKTYLGSADARVMVVSVDADDATAALMENLQGSAVVMSGQALGNVSDLGDAEIVQKAGSQPIDQLAIVRMTGTGDGATAIVTLYKQDGSSLGGFTASATTPAPPSDGRGASQGEMTSAVAEADERSSSPGSRRQFLDNYVGFRDWVGVNQYGAVVSTWSVPFKGQDRIPLKGVEFYEEIRQPELAAKYSKRRNVKTGVLIGSFALIAGGTVVSLLPVFGPSNCLERSEFGDICLEEESALNTTFFIGIGLLSAGTIGALVASRLNPHPIDPAQARKLAREHNERLAKELGIDLESLDDQVSQAPPTPPKLRFGLIPMRDGAGIAVGGEF